LHRLFFLDIKHGSIGRDKDLERDELAIHIDSLTQLHINGNQTKLLLIVQKLQIKLSLDERRKHLLN
jgi:hypothetical protein